MDDIVVRLVPLNTRTRTAWTHRHNKLNYVGASFQGFPERERASRGVTPLDTDKGMSSHAKDSEPEIRLSFSRPPKNISKGWVFGSDQNVCDVYCGEPEMVPFYNIGRQTFSITINKLGYVILKHLRDTNWTQVKYGMQKAGERQEFVWFMFPIDEEIIVTTANLLKFSVIVTKPRNQTALYKTLWTKFIKDIEDSMPSIPPLSVDSGTTTADTSLLSKRKPRPFYYIRIDRLLGAGSFGLVFHVVDVSTGIEYAGKRFYGGYNSSEPRILALQDHPYILKYVSLSNDDGPLLVTEYIKGGNLARPWRVRDRPAWQIPEIIVILGQCVSGLMHLHESANPVIHRDIRPENILVRPYDHHPSPWIKLADFGLAIEGTRCASRMGSWLYAAPEAFSTQEECTSKIDVWSLGVVLMQMLMHGRLPAPGNVPMQGPQWCKIIADKAKSNLKFYRNRDTNDRRLPQGTESFITALWSVVEMMLTQDPNLRPSARECLLPAQRLYLNAKQYLLNLAQGGPSQNPTQYPRNITSRSMADAEDERLLAQMDSERVFDSKVNGSVRATSAPEHSMKLSSNSPFNYGELYKSETATSANAGMEVAEALNDMEFKNETAPPGFDAGVEVAEALNDIKLGSRKTGKQPQRDNPQPVGFGLVHGDFDNEPAHQEQGSAATIKSEFDTKSPSPQPSRSQNSPKSGPSASTPRPPPRRTPFDGARERGQPSPEMKRAGSPSAESSHRGKRSSMSARAAEKYPAFDNEAGGIRKRNLQRER